MMNRRCGLLAVAALTLLTGATARAADAATEPPIFTWPANNLPLAMLYTAIFGALGIILAVVGFKVFDWCTPGDLQKEVFEKGNVAAAILGGSVIVGICLILAAAVRG